MILPAKVAKAYSEREGDQDQKKLSRAGRLVPFLIVFKQVVKIAGGCVLRIDAEAGPLARYRIIQSEKRWAADRWRVVAGRLCWARWFRRLLAWRRSLRNAGGNRRCDTLRLRSLCFGCSG